MWHLSVCLLWKILTSNESWNIWKFRVSSSNSVCVKENSYVPDFTVPNLLTTVVVFLKKSFYQKANFSKQRFIITHHSQSIVTTKKNAVAKAR